MKFNVGLFNRLNKKFHWTFLDYVSRSLYNHIRRVLSNNPAIPERNRDMTRSEKTYSPHSLRTALYSALFILGIAGTAAQATVMQWVGPGRWSDNTKWSPATVPTASDTAIFNSGNAPCTLDVSYSVGAVTFTTGYSGQFHFSNTLSVAGDADFRTNAAIFTYTGSLEFTGTASQNFYPKANAYTANQIRQNGVGGTHVKVNGFQCVNLNITSGVLYLDTTSADSVSGSFTNSGSGGIHFGVSTLKFAGQTFNLSTMNTLIAGTGTLEFCKDASPRQDFTPSQNYVHPRILHSGGDTLFQLASLRCNSFEQTKGTYNINGFCDTIVGGNFSITSGDSMSLAGLTGCYIVVQNGGNASFSGQSLDSLKMTAGATWYVNVYNGGSLTAQYAKVQNCYASGTSQGYAVYSDNVGGNTSWNFPLPNQKTWNNMTGDGKWGTAGNWAPPGLPSPADSVIFSASLPCTLNQSASVKAIRISASAGTFKFLDDTLRIADTADFAGMTGSTLDVATGALEFIGPAQHSLVSSIGLLLPVLIQNGTGSTVAKLNRFKAKGLVVKNGVFSCGNVSGDSITGALTVESGGTLLIGNADFHVNEASCFSGAGTLDFGTGSLWIEGPYNTALQFTNVNPGSGRIYFQQSGSWHMFYPPAGAVLPPIFKVDADSLVLAGALKSKGLSLSGGAWHWGSGGNGHVVDTIRTSGGSARMYFSFGPWDTVKTVGEVNLAGLASSGITAGAGIIVFQGAGAQTLSPLVNRLLPDIRHVGPGTLTLFGNLLCSSFFQNNGIVNTAGYNIVASGNFSIINGTASSIQGLGTGADSIAAGSATLKGQPGDTLNLNRPNAWKLYVNGALWVDFAKIKNCNASCSTGFANNSVDSGNTNWKFGKFWRGSSGDALWTTIYNWAPPGAPTAADSVVFDNSAMYGCLLDAAATVRGITFTAGCLRQFDFGANALTVNGTADFRSSGTIVPGTGTLELATNSNAWFYHPALNPMPKILKTGSGTVYMSDAARLLVPVLSVSNGMLEMFKPFTMDSLYVANPGILMFDNAVVHSDTVRALAGNGTLNMGWASLYVTGNADLSMYASVSVADRSRIIFAGTSPHAFAPPAVTTFPYVGITGSAVTTVSYRGLSVDTLDIVSGTFNCGASLADTVKSKLSGTGLLDFSSSALVVKSASLDLNAFAALFAGTGSLIFEGTASQALTPKAAVMHPGIICNNYNGLSISGNPLKAYSLTLRMGTISFTDAAVFHDSVGAVATLAGGSRGLDIGNDTLSVEGPVDLAASSVSFQPAAALRFIGNATQNFLPAPATQHPNIIHCGSGTLTQAGPLKCNSFLQTAGAYNLGGFSDTVTAGDFTIAGGSASSVTGLDNAAIVVSAGNASFSGQAGGLLNLFPSAPWRLNVSGTKSAQYANIGNCDASSGPAGTPWRCMLGSGNLNWDASAMAPRIFDTTGVPGYVFASQRKDGSDTVDLFYQLIDPDDALDTVSLQYRNGQSDAWKPVTLIYGDIGPVPAIDSSVHHHVRWYCAGDLGRLFASDSLQLMVTAIDVYFNKTGTITPNKSLMISTRPPLVASAALIAPNGNEKLPAGLPCNVSWNTALVSAAGQLKNSPIELAYSLDNGAGFPFVVASGLPNSGGYSWAVPMIAGGAVRMRIAVTDTFGHTGFDTSNASFTVDSAKPVSSVLGPVNRSYVNSLPSITGSASDAGSGIAGVQLVIQDMGNALFWDGSAWTAAQKWLSASGAQAWSFSGNSLVLTHGQSLSIVSRAVDSAGNEQASFAADTVFIDHRAPSSIVTFPINGGEIPALAAITGTAQDTGSGIASVMVSLKNQSSGLFWNGTSWGNTQEWIPATGGGAWTVSLPALINGNGYLVQSRAFDWAGNAETPAAGAAFTFRGSPDDAVAPACAIATHGRFGALTWPGAVSGTASDDLSGVRSVWVRLKNETSGYFWNNATWVTDSLWTTASGTGAWQVGVPAISLQNGRYVVQARAIDSAGNSGAAATDIIFYWGTPENNLIVVAAAVGDSAVSISWKADTAYRYVKNVLFGCGVAANLPDSNSLTPYPYRDTSLLVAHAVLPGRWYVVTRLLDSIGNVSPVRMDSVVIRNSPPMLSAPRDTSIDEGMPWLGVLTATDINGDSVRFRSQKAPAGLIVDSLSGAMHWTAGAADVGSATCIVAAYDTHGGVGADTFTIIVRMVNRPPAVSLTGDSVAREDGPFFARIRLSDPNPGDSAKLGFIRVPGWMKLSGDSLSGVPGENDVGIDTVLLVAVDGGGLCDTLAAALAVIHTNHAPALAGLFTADTLRQYGRAQWTISVSDRDRADSLFITWLNRPAWLTVSNTQVQGRQWTFTLTAAPTSLDKGWVRFAFSVRDIAGASVGAGDSVYIVSLPTTVIGQRQVAFGAVRYRVSGGNDGEPAAAFEARLRGLDDTAVVIERKNATGLFEFFPLLDGRYEFTVRAVDARGLRDTVPPTDVFAVSGASRHTYTDTSWTMASVPGFAYPVAALAADGHVLHWDESSGEENVYRYYRRESSLGRTVPGQAYWRKAQTPVAVSLAAADLRDSVADVRISKDVYGWNQVASPYPYCVKWPSAGTVWKWNNRTNDYEDAGGVLEPWQGYWVNADSSETVRIGASPVFSSGAASKRSVAYFAGASDWKIRVSLYGREGNDADNVFGFSPDALDGYDGADRPEPPRMSDGRYAFFWHPEWGRGVKEFASDVRRAMKKTAAFQIGIAPSPAGSAPVRIAFQGVENLASLYCYYADADTVFMIEGNREYELAPAASTVFKTVFVTADRDYLKKFPRKFTLVNPYPNPCRPVTIISYTLPYRFAASGLLNQRPYPVRLALFDAMGRKVRQIIDREQEPGIYRVVWDGKTAAGRIAAPGAYFCRLEAGEYCATTRMTMVR